MRREARYAIEVSSRFDVQCQESAECRAAAARVAEPPHGVFAGGAMTGKLTRCYELYRCQIQHEDILLNQRVTWIVTSQAFLLGTYVFLLNSPAFYALDSDADPQPLPGCDHILFNVSAFVGTINLARRVFQVVGLCSSIATCISSMAAVLAVGRLVRLYGRHLVALEHSERPGARRGLTQADVADEVSRIHAREGLPPLVTRRLYGMMGLAASVFFGPVFASAWVALIFPLQHRSAVLTLIVLALLLVLIGILPDKLRDHQSELPQRLLLHEVESERQNQ